MTKIIITIICFLLLNFTFAQSKNYFRTSYGEVKVNKPLTEKDCMEIALFMDSIRSEIDSMHARDNEIVYQVHILASTGRFSKRKKIRWNRNMSLLAKKMEDKFNTEEIVLKNYINREQAKDACVISVSLNIRSFEKK